MTDFVKAMLFMLAGMSLIFFGAWSVTYLEGNCSVNLPANKDDHEHK